MTTILGGSRTPSASSAVASRRVADQLKTAILEGEFLPGSRIMQEELATRFGASRLPVREALRILQSDGLVTLRSNQGAWVTRLSMDECIEIYRIRERVEPMLIEDSMQRLTQEDLDLILRLADELDHTRDIGEYFRFDREFHLESYRAAQMGYLHSMVERMWNATQYYRSAYTRLVDHQGSRWILDAEHRLLADAIARNNVEDAKQLIETHIRRTRVTLADHPEIFDIEGQDGTTVRSSSM
ncbi:GntR family transcriptional regulator [Agromyces sp. ZXT2-6]|uniref:GntR family transcriptional regulator n=1 Tax=Agromyces sp. ZXT2-6 TaxID=3461153 RepID=UPI00405517A5